MSDAPKKAPPTTVVIDDPDQLEGSSLVYANTCLWVANYVRTRAAVGQYTEDQLIEQFGVNVRRCIDPDWRPHG